MHNMSEAMQLVSGANVSHVAINNGSWFDPNTWEGGQIPTSNARVVIPVGVEVTYDEVSEISIFSIGVRGKLSFATQIDTKLKVDTLVVDHTGELSVGSAENPIADNVTADIIFANNGAIDVLWDPTLLSRGLVALGKVEIHGQEKSSHHKVSIDPMAGDTSLELVDIPTNWNVGDTIVIAGSRFDGHKWDNSIRDVRYHGTEDEIRTITALTGNSITLDRALVYDHDSPRADLKISVANYTRNVTFASEENASVSERGHVMLHSRDSDIRYAAFDDLGRTDKSFAALDASAFGSAIQSDSNVQGRYSLHFHNNGVDNPENSALAIGNAVSGSPGWGMVHHNSTVTFHNNATYDTFGAGFVAETGNEVGAWTNNIAIKAEGRGYSNPKNLVDLTTFDMATSGDGFWFQGRLVQAEGNVAASVAHGYTYFHRGASTDDPSVRGNIFLQDGQFGLKEALDGQRNITIDDAPILNFSNNETFASHQGLIVVKANPNQGHDIHSEFNDFTAWSVELGAEFEYTAHYNISNFDLVAKQDTPFSSSRAGIVIGRNASDFIISDATIDGFNTAGIVLSHDWTGTGRTLDQKQFVIVNPTFLNLGNTATQIEGFDPTYDQLIDSSSLSPTSVSIELEGPLTYRESYNIPGTRTVEIKGVKTDSLGQTPIPAGDDSYNIGRDQVIHILETDGYFTTPDGEKIFFIEHYYSDRLTGEIFKFSSPVYLNDDVNLGNPYFSYANAIDKGEVQLNKEPPIAMGETVRVQTGQDTIIDIASNDSDPDGSGVFLDGIVPPDHGQIFDNGDGTVTYRPFLDYTGQEIVKYWISDGAGNLTEAWLTINVVSQSAPVVAPQITSASNVSIAEENIFVLDVNATDDLDAEGSGLRYGISGGADASSFGIDASSGVLTFLTAPDFESPGDADSDNVYEVEVTVDDSQGLSDSRGVSVTVSDVAEDVDSQSFNPDDYGTQLIGDGADNPIQGTEFDDWIEGRGGNDRINGGAGDDYIVAGLGTDNFVRGGSGADVFQFSVGDMVVKIADFEDGIDKIYLTDSLTFNDFTRSISTFKGVTSAKFTTATGDRLIIGNINPDDIDRSDFLSPSATGNFAPVAGNDLFSTPTATELSIPAIGGVLSNDSDANGDLLTATLLSDVSHGDLELNADGSFNYTPAVGFSGRDNFQYSVSDGKGGSDAGEVSIAITGRGNLFDPTDFDSQLYGNDQNNPISGTDQNDWIEGGDGNDKIDGGGGDDYIISGTGTDNYVRGGSGNDIFQFSPGDMVVKIADFEDGTDAVYLAGGLTFDDFTQTISNFNGVTSVKLTTDSGDRLIFGDVIPNDIDASDFLTASGNDSESLEIL